MQKRQLFINAIMSLLQIVVVSAVLFILYRFLLNTIGVEQLGIWSLVLATTAVTQIGNLGLSGSVVKFVAKYVARGEPESVSAVIQTAVLSVGVFVGFILLAGYPVAQWVLRLVVSDEFLPYALAILPYALLALWIMVITSIFQAGLDGYQRIDLRSYLLMGGAIIHLLLCFILAPTYGLIGVAYARIIQNSAILLSTWVLLKKHVPSLPIFPSNWSKNIFKEIIGYGINFQLISVTSMFYDPITKALLSKFGGLSMLGYYEMASKMVQQFRALIVSANQVIVPTIADVKERTPERVQSIYLTSYQLLFYLALPLYSLIVVCTPIISELWIGHYERLFVVFGVLLSIGWFLNTLAGPAYFTNLGIGELRWNVLGHMTISFLNVGFGLLLGILYGGIGVVIAWVFSLTLGSSVIFLSYPVRHKIPFFELLPKASRRIFAACLTGILATTVIQRGFNYKINTITLEAIILLSFSLIVFVPFWLHPMRKRLMGWVTGELLSK